MGDSNFPLQNLTEILQKIYIETLQQKKIAEQNYLVTEQLLQKANTEDSYTTNIFPNSMKHTCACNRSNPARYKKGNSEEKYVEDIENMLKKANRVRSATSRPSTTEIKKLSKNKSTYHGNKQVQSTTCITAKKSSGKEHNIDSQIGGRSFILQTRLEELQDILQSNEEPKSGSVPLNSQMAIVSTTKSKSISTIDSRKVPTEHSSHCPLSITHSNKNLRSKSRLSVGYPASLERIRLSPEMQRALKLYYKFIIDKSKSLEEKKTKMKVNFLNKLQEYNSLKWERNQKEEYKLFFELDVYINNYNKRINESNGNQKSLLCKFYDKIEDINEVERFFSEKSKSDMYKEILSYIHSHILDFIQSSDFQRELLPLIYKTIMNIISVSRSDKFSNIVVFKP